MGKDKVFRDEHIDQDGIISVPTMSHPQVDSMHLILFNSSLLEIVEKGLCFYFLLDSNLQNCMIG